MTPQYIHIDRDGDKFYFKDKEMKVRHREDGPAIEFGNGYKAWYIDNKEHREDGPAIIFSNGDEAWYRNGLLHREDGPAVVFTNGTIRWHLNGEQVSEAEHARRTSKVVELTMDQIAKLAGIDVSKLKIVKN